MASIEFGKKLSELRKNAGLTQQQTADYLNIPNKSTVASWEIGKSEPSANVLMRLCELYGVKDVLSTFSLALLGIEPPPSVKKAPAASTAEALREGIEGILGRPATLEDLTYAREVLEAYAKTIKKSPD